MQTQFDQMLLLYKLTCVPCILLIILIPYELLKIKSQPKQIGTWTLVNISKLIISTFLVILSLVHLFYDLIKQDGESVVVVEIFETSLEIICFVIIFILTLLEKSRNIHTSGVTFTFWLFFFIFDLIIYIFILFQTFQLTNISKNPTDEFHYIYRTLHIAFVFSSFLLNCISDYKTDLNAKSCPINKASYLSILTFWWLNSMIRLGYRKPLTEDDMWNLNKEYETRTVFELFSKQYNKIFRSSKVSEKSLNEESENFLGNESQVDTENKIKNINIIKPFFKTYKYELLKAAFYKLISVLVSFAQPFILDLILTYVRSRDEIIWKGYFFAISMLVASAIESILNNRYQILINQTSMKLKSALTVTIYKKSLLLSASGRKDFTTGEIVNLMAIDIQRIIDYLDMMNLIWANALQIIISIALIWMQLGLATIAGIGIMILMMVPNSWISDQFKKQQTLLMTHKDERSKILNEALSGVKVLKLYAWSNAFIKRITLFRDKEIHSLKILMICFSSMAFVFNLTPFLVSLVSFVTYVLAYTEFDNQLNANKIFVSLSLFNIIRIPLGSIPFLISNGLMCFISIKRVNKYLSGHELDEQKTETSKDKNYPIEMQQCNFSWNDDDHTLKNITFKVKRKSLVAIVGSVGSGKSSLLSALLGEMRKTSGKVLISDTVAYVPQVAFIQNATVRENITFAQIYDKNKYDDIIERTQLEQDLKILRGGDMCEIGEKGINLSGGQKQRVNIARAVYSDKEIYLFDDPLSALDSNVGKAIFDKIISNDGLLRNKTRLLVTHQISLLKRVDHIIVMKDGSILEQGNYEDLMEKKGNFSQLALQFSIDDHHMIEDNEELLNSIKEEIPTEFEKKESFSGNVSLTSSQRLKKSKPSALSINSELNKNLEKENESDPSKIQKEQGRLIELEKMEIGSVKKAVYLKYMRFLGIGWYLLAIIGYTISHSLNILSQLWLSKWSDSSTNQAIFNESVLENRFLIGYSLFGFLELIFVFFSTITVCLACLIAAKKIHNQMLQNVFAAPMIFFDMTPLGRIMNRFSKDIDTADLRMYTSVRGVILYNFRALVSFTLISIETPWFLIALIPIIILYIIIQTFYISTSRQLKRLESTTRSPIYSHFQETITGASSIRAYNLSDKFVQECCNRVDTNHRVYYPNINATGWLAVRLEFLAYSIVFLSSLFAIIFRDNLSPGLVGVSITSALTMTNTLNFLIKSFSDLETNIVSIERCLEYTKLESERPSEIPDKKPKSEWPSKGVITFENYSTKYRAELDLVLNGVNFTIEDGEKVGIVGRTGAGKSTIALSLFRIIESVTGKIVIDTIDIGQIGLNDLRSKLTIIPQDSILFTGSVRFNLDPYETYTDDDIWKALEQAHLKEYVTGLQTGLEFILAEGGENLSIGQRQLICLARALLRRTRILILDEATASIDIKTDELIQETIRREFANNTILTIAHRLNTIMDYDKILVLDQGKIVEFASPEDLLNDKETIFYEMAQKSGLI